MSYPVTPDNLVDETSTSEQATLLVIEAIMNSSFTRVALVDESTRDELYENVVSWTHFDEYCSLISAQKTLLVSYGHPDHEPEDEDIDTLVSHALDHYDIVRARKKVSRFTHVTSAAAVIVFVTLGVSVGLSSRENSPALQAQSEKKMTSEQRIQSPSEDSFGIETSHTDENFESPPSTIAPSRSYTSDPSSGSVAPTKQSQHTDRVVSAAKPSAPYDLHSLRMRLSLGFLICAGVLFSLALVAYSRSK